MVPSTTTTGTPWSALLVKPPRFQPGSTGCTRPEASVARARSRCSPGVASHGALKARQAQRPCSLPSPACDPGGGVVGAHLDPGHRCPARPGAATQHGRPGPQHPRAGHEVGEPGRLEQRARLDAGDRLADLVGLLAQSVGAVLVPVEALGRDRDPAQPLHVAHAVPARDDDPHREAVLDRQRGAVHLVGHQHVGRHRLGQVQPALVVLLDPALDAVVGAGEDHVDRLVEQAGLGQQVAEADTGPVRRAHRAVQPGLAQRPRLQGGASVPAHSMVTRTCAGGGPAARRGRG